jgi:hypothetical protein
MGKIFKEKNFLFLNLFILLVTIGSFHLKPIRSLVKWYMPVITDLEG